MVAAILLAIGISGAMAALGAMADARYRIIESERMQRLAFDKYDELVGTVSYSTASLSGDFSDRYESRYTWRADLTETGTTNIYSLTVYVDPVAGRDAKTVQITGLLYIASTSGSSSSSSGSSGGTTSRSSVGTRSSSGSLQ
jgi:uncharacterized membrane protein YgcG